MKEKDHGKQARRLSPLDAPMFQLFAMHTKVKTMFPKGIRGLSPPINPPLSSAGRSYPVKAIKLLNKFCDKGLGTWSPAHASML